MLATDLHATISASWAIHFYGDFPLSCGVAMEKYIANVIPLMQIVGALILGFFAIRVFATLLSGQIDHALGRPGALASVAQSLLYSLMIVAVTVNAGGIGRALGLLACSNDIRTVDQAVALVFEMVVDPLRGLVVALLVVLTVSAVALRVAQGQVGALIGTPRALVSGILGGVGAILLLLVGLGALMAGASLLN